MSTATTKQIEPLKPALQSHNKYAAHPWRREQKSSPESIFPAPGEI